MVNAILRGLRDAGLAITTLGLIHSFVPTKTRGILEGNHSKNCQVVLIVPTGLNVVSFLE